MRHAQPGLQQNVALVETVLHGTADASTDPSGSKHTAAAEFARAILVPNVETEDAVDVTKNKERSRKKIMLRYAHEYGIEGDN